MSKNAKVKKTVASSKAGNCFFMQLSSYKYYQTYNREP
jgi:hypothetical protein